MFWKKLKDKLNDTENELHWLRGYVSVLEDGIEDIRELINESDGVEWDKLLSGSMFSLAEFDMAEKKREYTKSATDRVTTEARKELWIKVYTHMPLEVAYTPIYGGMKYVRVENDPST